jgi:hypothetical protein
MNVVTRRTRTVAGSAIALCTLALCVGCSLAAYHWFLGGPSAVDGTMAATAYSPDGLLELRVFEDVSGGVTGVSTGHVELYDRHGRRLRACTADYRSLPDGPTQIRFCCASRGAGEGMSLAPRTDAATTCGRPAPRTSCSPAPSFLRPEHSSLAWGLSRSSPLCVTPQGWRSAAICPSGPYPDEEPLLRAF